MNDKQTTDQSFSLTILAENKRDAHVLETFAENFPDNPVPSQHVK
jgi:hypothetical protein